MTGGYLRLSKDEDKKNYISIENQKLIIKQYAASAGFKIDKWYEDDNISGYTFDRPAFQQMVDDMEKGLNIIIAKDLSRIGRHNAKVLLFLDTVKEQGNRILLIDDNYDTLKDDDDTIGIKTWYNERYVKETSKKIRRVFRARQQEGTLYHNVPFGYRRNAEEKSKIEVICKEAEIVKLIFQLYLEGKGYRKISIYLNERYVLTPSMSERDEYAEKGKPYRKQVAMRWSDCMIRDILKNDFYIGTIRFHKKERFMIHGVDRKVPKEEQIAFEDNHEPIIDKVMYDTVQEIMRNRVKTNDRGQGKHDCIFTGFLYCKDCKCRLTPIIRKSKNTKKYYICSTYNSKGKQYCAHPHSVKEDILKESVISYLAFCKENLGNEMKSYDMKQIEDEKENYTERIEETTAQLMKAKAELKTVVSQKIREIALHPENNKTIEEVYNEIQGEILNRICLIETRIKKYKQIQQSVLGTKNHSQSAESILDQMIKKKDLTRQDVSILINKVIVDKDGGSTIYFNAKMEGAGNHDFTAKRNHDEEETLRCVLQGIIEEKRPYTSAKYLSAYVTSTGHKKSRKSILPYINILINNKILSPTDDPLKPYLIIKEKKELNQILDKFFSRF